MPEGQSRQPMFHCENSVETHKSIFFD